MGRQKFKEFIKEEGLDKNKTKSSIRIGWDGRQEEIDFLDELNETLRKQSIKNFERYEETRATVVKLEELIEDNKYLVKKATVLNDQNVELLDENKKINRALEGIAKDLADYVINLKNKDEEIATMKINHKQQIRSLRK